MHRAGRIEVVKAEAAKAVEGIAIPRQAAIRTKRTTSTVDPLRKVDPSAQCIDSAQAALHRAFLSRLCACEMILRVQRAAAGTGVALHTRIPGRGAAATSTGVAAHTRIPGSGAAAAIERDRSVVPSAGARRCARPAAQSEDYGSGEPEAKQALSTSPIAHWASVKRSPVSVKTLSITCNARMSAWRETFHHQHRKSIARLDLWGYLHAGVQSSV